jgi:high-affinity K+ transport system ATPase subunit B
MSLATIAALVTGEYAEAVFVMLFYQVGELFEHIAVGKSRDSIKSLLSIRADTAFVENENGELYEVDCEEINVGDIITVKSGGKIPLDGVIVEGSSSLNTVALTGESLPRGVEAGDEAEMAVEGVRRYRRWLKSIDMPLTFEELGAKEEDIPKLVKTLGLKGNLLGAFRPLGDEDVANILRRAASVV